MLRNCLKILLPIILVGTTASAQTFAQETRRLLEYAPAPIDNPLQGLVPYQGDVRERFPHSMEFNYLAYSDLVKGYDEFDWQPLENLLDDVASRGHQTVFRIFLEYPNKEGILPSFLIEEGLQVHKYLNTNTQPFPPAQVATPNYEDKNLRRSLKNFIAALGRQYDGDPRIGFITAGLLGTWGEWHTYPRNELFASKQVQLEVMDAYEAAFQVTPVLLRYPAGDNHYSQAKNSDRRFGYHDDSFAWATLDTGKPEEDWFYMTTVKAAGAESKWKLYPIGGEIRPESWGKVFDVHPQHPQIQDFCQCVEATHVSWLMDSGIFQPNQPRERIQRARQAVQRMGYEFHASAVTLRDVKDGKFSVSLEIENRGVAPFYYDWKPEYALINSGLTTKIFAGSGSLKGLLPTDQPRIWHEELVVSDVEGGVYILAVRVPNPLDNGAPARFANANQETESGWLPLVEVEIR